MFILVYVVLATLGPLTHATSLLAEFDERDLHPLPERLIAELLHVQRQRLVLAESPEARHITHVAANGIVAREECVGNLARPGLLARVSRGRLGSKAERKNYREARQTYAEWEEVRDTSMSLRRRHAENTLRYESALGEALERIARAVVNEALGPIRPEWARDLSEPSMTEPAPDEINAEVTFKLGLANATLTVRLKEKRGRVLAGIVFDRHVATLYPYFYDAFRPGWVINDDAEVLRVNTLDRFLTLYGFQDVAHTERDQLAARALVNTELRTQINQVVYAFKSLAQERPDIIESSRGVLRLIVDYWTLNHVPGEAATLLPTHFILDSLVLDPELTTHFRDALTQEIASARAERRAPVPMNIYDKVRDRLIAPAPYQILFQENGRGLLAHSTAEERSATHMGNHRSLLVAHLRLPGIDPQAWQMTDPRFFAWDCAQYPSHTILPCADQVAPLLEYPEPQRRSPGR